MSRRTAMAKPRSPAADFALYLLIRIVVCVVQSLPHATAVRLAGGVAWLISRANRRHRFVAFDNLRHAFPGRYGDAELDALVRSVYRHFLTMAVEILFLPRKFHPNTWRRYLVAPDPRLLEQLLSGRPLLLVTGHFGNWELGGYVLGVLGFHTHAIARPIDHPYLDEFLRRFRERKGQRILAKHGDFDAMQGLLGSGGVLATLADQDAGQRGVFVDYFGRPASTHKAVALLSLQFGVPLVVLGVRKEGEPMCYRLAVEDVILPEDYANVPGANKAVTQRFTSALERVVCTAPAQYL